MTADEQRTLRGIVAGLGVMGSHHLRVLLSLDRAEIVAVVDPNPERWASARRSRPGLAAYASLGEALERHGADFVGLAVPVDQLAECAHEALAANAHVLVEKPTASNDSEAVGVIEDARRRGLTLAAGHVERFNPAIVELKHKLDQGMIGRIYQMHARRLSPFPERDSMQGVSLDLATHDIDVMRYLAGSEVKRVFAETSRRLRNSSEDLLCATLRFENEVAALLEVNWLTPTKVRELSVTGERGMFRVDYLTQDLFFFEHPIESNEWGTLANMRGPGEGDMVRYAITRREPLWMEWMAFLSAVRTGQPPPVDGHDGLAALSTAHAIKRSGETHETVIPSYRSLPGYRA